MLLETLLFSEFSECTLDCRQPVATEVGRHHEDVLAGQDGPQEKVRLTRARLTHQPDLPRADKLVAALDDDGRGILASLLNNFRLARGRSGGSLFTGCHSSISS